MLAALRWGGRRYQNAERVRMHLEQQVVVPRNQRESVASIEIEGRLGGCPEPELAAVCEL